MKTCSSTEPKYKTKGSSIVNQAIEYLQNSLKKEGVILESSQEAKDLCTLELSGHTKEQLYVLYLDASHRLIKSEVLCSGTTTSNTVYLRELMEKILGYGASAILISHNHPSGSVSFSDPDLHLTKNIIKAFKPFNVSLLDHVLVGAGHAVSLRDNNPSLWNQ